MMLRILIFALTALFATTTLAAEQVHVDYQYDGNHRADLSRARGSLQLGEFSDERGLDDGRTIVDGHQAEAELSTVLRNALVQGFEHGNASLVESEGDFIVSGNLTSIETAEVDDGIQLTMRVNLQLNRGGRSIWQTNLFGRGTAESIGEATHAALTRLIRELMNDDYFLIELQ